VGHHPPAQELDGADVAAASATKKWIFAEPASAMRTSASDAITSATVAAFVELVLDPLQGGQRSARILRGYSVSSSHISSTARRVH